MRTVPSWGMALGLVLYGGDYKADTVICKDLSLRFVEEATFPLKKGPFLQPGAADSELSPPPQDNRSLRRDGVTRGSHRQRDTGAGEAPQRGCAGGRPAVSRRRDLEGGASGG